MPNPRQSTNNATSATSTDRRTSDGAKAIVVEDNSSDKEAGNHGADEGATTDEGNDTKLGMCPIILVLCLLVDWSSSLTPKGVGCTCICVLQRSPNLSIH